MLPTLVIATAGSGPAWRWRRPVRLSAYWAITSASLACFILAHAFERWTGPMALALAVCGAAGCGWSWLLTRALFDPAERDALWPRLVVLIIIASGGLSVLAQFRDATLPAWIDNVGALASSTALLLAFVEPFSTYRRDLAAEEKGFRLVYAGGYGALVAFSVLLLRGGEAARAEHAELVKSACALAALIAAAAAVGYRLRHPLAARAGVARRPSPSPEDAHLATQIARLMREDEIYATPDLKVAHLARRLRQPDYRITQAITAGLGYPNFNRLVNHYRIAHAKQMLADPALAGQPIALIAFDSGFGSVGPFNRAFKDETGMTPRVFRAASQAAPPAP